MKFDAEKFEREYNDLNMIFIFYKIVFMIFSSFKIVYLGIINDKVKSYS